METIRLKSPDDKFYPEFMSLYEDAFPDFERRTHIQQARALSDERFYLNALKNSDGSFAGFIAFWDFGENTFIEHFAVAPNLRGEGVGSKIINGFLKENPKPCILEIEFPDNKNSERRLRFYETFGFVSTPFCISPIYGLKDGGQQLLIMSHPYAISREEFEVFYSKYRSSI